MAKNQQQEASVRGMPRHNKSHGHGKSPYLTYAVTAPLWDDVGHGIISLKSNPHTRMRQVAGRWVPVSSQEMTHLMQQVAAQQAALEAEAATTETATA